MSSRTASLRFRRQAVLILFVAASCVVGVAGAAVSGTCWGHGNIKAYTRYEETTPAIIADAEGNPIPTCYASPGRVCYECATYQKPTNDWWYCAENEEGTWGNCNGFVEWTDIPWIDPIRI